MVMHRDAVMLFILISTLSFPFFVANTFESLDVCRSRKNYDHTTLEILYKVNLCNSLVALIRFCERLKHISFTIFTQNRIIHNEEITIT